MGLLSKIFGKKRPATSPARGYRTLTEDYPFFASYDGKLYEQELTRAAIERFASACSKLKPEVTGHASRAAERLVRTRPNEQMTWPTFLSRLATIYEVDDTAFVVPSFKRDMQTIDGLWPLKCEYAEVLEYGGEPWVRFHFATGEVSALELRYVVILAKFQYSSDYFGERNCLDGTLGLMASQAQAQEAAMVNGARVRFIGSLVGQVREEDLKAKRERFVTENLGRDNAGGLLLYDNTFADLKQVQPYSYTIDTDEMERIEQNVYDYFGINEDILQNKYSEDTWGAWYEGRVEPFCLRLGEGLTNVFFSQAQQMHGNRIMFSSNRLEYASNASKRNMVRDMVDRGIMTINEGREVLQMAPVEGGDVRVIRGEYVAASTLVLGNGVLTVSGERLEEDDFDSVSDPGGDDDIYKDSNAYGGGDFDAGS